MKMKRLPDSLRARYVPARLTTPCDEGAILAGREGAPCRKGAERWVLAATILGSSMAFIDGTAVNVALPALQADLGATVAEVQWVVEAYALFLSALLLVAARWGTASAGAGSSSWASPGSPWPRRRAASRRTRSN